MIPRIVNINTATPSPAALLENLPYRRGQRLKNTKGAHIMSSIPLLFESSSGRDQDER